MKMKPATRQRYFQGTILTALWAGLMFQLFNPLRLLAAEQLGGALPAAMPTGLTGNQETISLTFAIFKTLGALIIVVGLMLLLLFWIKKMGILQSNPREEGLIKILGQQMLAPKKQISVLEVAGTYIVIGLTEQHLTLLTTLEANEQLKDAACSLTPSSPVLTASFASLLSKAVQSISELKAKKGGPTNEA